MSVGDATDPRNDDAHHSELRDTELTEHSASDPTKTHGEELRVAAARVREALAATDAYVAREDFSGFDPYDALSSPIFGLPLLRSSHYARLIAQQVLKRLLLNVRPALGIRKKVSAVSVARMLEGYAHLFAIEPSRRDYYADRIELCLRRIDALRSRGYSGHCWGYEFDWEPHYAARPIPAGFPNIVATGIVTNALFETHRLTGMETPVDSCVSAADFVLRDLEKTVGTDGSYCWGYFPSDRQLVPNATMKAARLCAQAFSLTGDHELCSAARATVKFVAAHQRADGAWPYSIGDTRSWVDNFHTGYLLECMEAYERYTNDSSFRSAKTRGWEYYRASFLTDDYIPKYFDRRVTPIDATACAQTISTLSTFGDVLSAIRVASWTLGKMRRPDGAFIYQRHSRFTNRIPYMRWSIAPMYCSLARLLFAIEDPRHAAAKSAP
jgi:hypothetical protein